MSALDRLQNYSARQNEIKSEVFDVKTPNGYFLQKLHEKGYLMYENYYEDTLGNSLSENDYNWLSDEDKLRYTKKFKYTELHDMLTTSGDQLVLANAGSGKALVNDTDVLTPTGYRHIGNLKVGDKVFGTDLQVHNVLGVYPQGKKKVNSVFIESDAERLTINCCDEHLWAIKGSNETEVISTNDVKRRLKNRSSLSLVDVSSIEFDSRGIHTISDINIACILFAFFHLTYNGNILSDDECSKLIDEYVYDNTHKVVVQDYTYNDYFIEELIKSLKTSDLKLSIEDSNDGWKTYNFLYSDRLLEVLKSKSIINDISIKSLLKYVIPILCTQSTDALNIFNGRKCQFRIIGVSESENEEEMTCIEVDSEDHLFLIDSLVPTHNTTALIFKIMYDIITGEATKTVSVPTGNKVTIVDDIFVGTFLKTGASELKERLEYWQRGLKYTETADRINFSTLHAEFKRALNSMGAATPIGKPSDITKCLKKAINNLGITHEGSPLTSEDYNIISGIVTYYRGRLDNKRYSHPSAMEYGLTAPILDRLVNDFARQRQLDGIMDFEDLQELLYKFLYVTPNKAVQDFCANRYKYIYLDEFQDTSQIQYAILKFYARGRLWMNRGVASEEDKNSQLYTGIESQGKIVCVGDNDQCIYGWRGSDNHIIEYDFEHDFKPCNSNLSYNYRCPSNILNAVIPSIKMNHGNENRAYKASRLGGVARGYKFFTYKQMLNQLVADIDEDMEMNNTVAILCRTNFDGVIPAFILEANKKYDFSISGENMTLDSPLPKKLIAMSSIFTERSSQAVKNTLSMFVPRFAEWSVKQLVDTLKTNNKSIWQIPEADIDYSCPELLPMVQSLKSIFFENGKRVQKKEIEALKFIYKWSMINVFGGKSLYCESARAYIDALLYLIESNNFESVFDFLDTVYSLNEKLHARINNKKARISIATVHEFKGKEMDSVYVWNDSEGVFPSSKTDLENVEQVEDERRVHYVACTRAKKKSTIYTLSGKEGLFVNEMGLEFEYPTEISGTLNKNSADENISDDEKNLLEIMQSV